MVCVTNRTYRATSHSTSHSMTAMNEPDLEAKGAEAGAPLSLRKPFNFEQVVRTVEPLLGRKGRSETP